MTEQMELKSYPEDPGYQDEDTSRDAAVSMSGCANAIRNRCLSVLESWGPLSPDEIAQALGLSVLAVRPRITELKRKGFVEITDQKRANKSGRLARVVRLKGKQ